MLKNKIAEYNIARAHGLGDTWVKGRIHNKAYSLRLKFLNPTTSYVAEAIGQNKAHQMLEKEYAWYLKSEKKSYVPEKQLNKTIWWCWFQGLESAPPLVKMCLDSVKRNFSGYKVNVITMNNISNYLDIPDFIQKKFDIGIIPYAQFSDIIRIMLLAKYGGVWIDSTVFCSNNKIKSVIESNNFFVYKNGILGNNQDIKISNWFISAKKGVFWTNELQRLLFDYWKNHDYLENYFIFHILFTLITEKYPNEWNAIPSYNNVSPHMMVQELNDKFSIKRYRELDSFSSLHKLNHHVKFDDSEGTLYNYLINKLWDKNERKRI